MRRRCRPNAARGAADQVVQGATEDRAVADLGVIAGQGAEDLAIGRRMVRAAVHPDQGLVAGRPEAEEDRVDLVRQPKR